MRDPEWIDVHKYSATSEIFEGEIGKLAGVRFVESTEAKIFGDSGSENRDVYSTLVLGANAYGVTDVEGGGLEHIVKQKGYGNDPLNQRSSVGWKATKVAKRLLEEYIIRFESGSAFSATAEEN